MDSLVFMLGMGLVIAQGVTSGEFQTMWGLVYNTAAPKDPKSAKAEVFSFGFQILFVVILSMVAQISTKIGGLLVTLLIALWIVWGLNNSSTINSFGSKLAGGVKGATGQ